MCVRPIARGLASLAADYQHACLQTAAQQHSSLRVIPQKVKTQGLISGWAPQPDTQEFMGEGCRDVAQECNHIARQSKAAGYREQLNKQRLRLLVQAVHHVACYADSGHNQLCLDEDNENDQLCSALQAIASLARSAACSRLKMQFNLLGRSRAACSGKHAYSAGASKSHHPDRQSR